MKPSIFDSQHLYLKDYLFKLFPAGKLNGNEFTVGNIQGDAGDSLSFNINKGCGSDFGTGQVFKSIVELVQEKFGLEEQAAFKKIEDDWNIKDNIIALAQKTKKKKEFRQVPFDKSKSLTIPHYFTSKYGDPIGRWLYETADGQGVGWIVRFDTPEGKQYFPFVYGDDNAWHSKAFDKPRPLYNLPELSKTKNIVLIVEGEKDAENAKQLLPSLTVTTWAGGANAIDQTDWAPLQGKRILIARDNDTPGEKAQKKIAEIGLDLACRIRIFKEDAFEDRPDGWSIADLLESQEFEGRQVEEWIKQNIMEYQRGGAGSSGSTLDENKSAQVSEEPINRHYRTLGLISNKFALYNYHSGQVMLFSPDGLTKKSLIALVSGDTSYWKRFTYILNEDGKISWDAITGIIARDCYAAGQFDSDRVRGLGCWIDKNRIVFNAGDFLYVEGEKIPINDFESYYVYERNTPILRSMERESDRNELEQLLELCNMFAWEYPVSGNLMAGWLMIAPICGALPWRPHIYITGMAGTGKSTIHDNLLARTLGDCSVVTLGDSTKAGLAQSTMSDALPIIFDEIENDSKTDEMRNDMVLRMARYSSSSQKGKTLKGRADQSGAEGYVSRSCFCFSSITPSVKHYADYSRITLLPLMVDHSATKEVAVEHYKKIIARVKTLMGEDTNSTEFSERFITYANRNALNIIESYKVLKETAQLSLTGFSARIADQIGMLLAGFWAYKSDKPITADEAEILLKAYTWEDLIPNKRQENQMVLVSKLRQYKVHLVNENSQKKYTRTIADLIDFMNYNGVYPHNDENYFEKAYIVNVLQDIGIRLETNANNFAYVAVSNTSQTLGHILQNSQWATNWHHSLKAIEGAFVSPVPKYFGKSIGTQRCVMIPLDVFISGGDA